MNDAINKLKEWNEATSNPIPGEPVLPTNDRIDFRLSLIEEELKELGDAGFNRDITGVLDALCDLQYVLLGTVFEFGLQDVFSEAFDEVHRSNMSKFLKYTSDARESALRYVDKGIDAHYKKVGKHFVVRRNEDDKILKGMFFFEPRLRELLKRKAAERKVVKVE